MITFGNLYKYDGPVLEFGKLVADHWESETVAKSEAKARVNFAYQFKHQTGRDVRTVITMPGQIVMVERTE